MGSPSATQMYRALKASCMGDFGIRLLQCLWFRGSCFDCQSGTLVMPVANH